jgi:hypothetical protein
MSSSKHGQFSVAHILFPMTLLALVVFISMAFQSIQVFRDRAALHQARIQQDKPVEDVRKLQAQLEALATGTLKLAEKGDKNAQGIIDRLKKLGVTVGQPKADSSATPPASADVAVPAKP